MACSNHHFGFAAGCPLCENNDNWNKASDEAYWREKDRQKDLDRYRREQQKRQNKRDRSARQDSAPRAGASGGSAWEDMLIAIPLVLMAALAVVLFLAKIAFAAAWLTGLVAAALIVARMAGRAPAGLAWLSTTTLAQGVAVGALGWLGAAQEPTTQIVGFGPKFSAAVLILAAAVTLWGGWVVKSTYLVYIQREKCGPEQPDSDV